MPTGLERSALAAATAIVDNFANHRREAYFAAFAPEATFIFHSEPARVESRAAYEELWAGWERDSGWRVRSCTSTGARIQLFGSVAVFTHDVETVVEVDGTEETLHERESIVLESRNGGWICVHEHLSAAPASA
ncbi:MAG: nuclear transport factor 2 family protein [Ramlibacter sp.]|nr:nuclear transport factor 2 family protein [Cryobacterium sp.]